MHISSMSAVAITDLGELREQAAAVEQAQVRPSMIERATESIHHLTAMACRGWDQLEEGHRDLFRALARHLTSDQKPSWFARQRAKLEVARMFSRHGIAGTFKHVADFENARQRFASAVFAADEKNNEALQTMIADAVTLALDPSSDAVTITSKERLGEWFKQLPS